MANSVDPDVMVHYQEYFEPSHLDLHCLHMYQFWSAGQKGLKSLWDCADIQAY